MLHTGAEQSSNPPVPLSKSSANCIATKSLDNHWDIGPGNILTLHKLLVLNWTTNKS